MYVCALKIAERTAVQSRGGPLECEYALVDASEIQLRATDPGIIREVGYRTTVSDARERLVASGVSRSLVTEAAGLMGPRLAVEYARGAAVRRIAARLGPSELFEAATYDSPSRRYEGTWLDLAALARDLRVPRASVALQALYLLARLGDEDSGAAVVIDTLTYAQDRRPGERSYRRVSLEHTKDVVAALRALSETGRPPPEASAGGADAGPEPRPAAGEVAPTRSELLELLQARQVTASPSRRAHLVALAEGLRAREIPARGPLADPELWALDARLSHGELTGVLERLEDLERTHGRLPATTYLRARAALLAKTEPAQAIAERVSALATSMSAFWELELLASQAWNQAGDRRRAKAFARDLVENPGAPDEIRIQALEVLESIPPDRAITPPESSPRPSQRPIAPQRIVNLTPLPPAPNAPASRRSPAAGTSQPPPARGSGPRVPAPAPTPDELPPVEEPTIPNRLEAPISRPAPTGPNSAPRSGPARTPPVPGLGDMEDPPPTLMDPMMPPAPRNLGISVPPPLPRLAPLAEEPAPDTSPYPTTEADNLVRSRTPAYGLTPRPGPLGKSPREAEATMETRRVDASFNDALERVRGQPDAASEPRISSPTPVIDGVRTELVDDSAPDLAARADASATRNAQPPPAGRFGGPGGGLPAHPLRARFGAIDLPGAQPPRLYPAEGARRAPPPPPRPTPTPAPGPTAARFGGASQPPFSTEPPPQEATRRGPPRRAPVEAAETLSLPPGLTGPGPARLDRPQTLTEARVVFTHQTRELGRDYKARGIDLRTDVRSIEIIQRTLHERFPDGRVSDMAGMMEVQRHGAFLSEILARTLGAYWVDIAPSDMGYWAMIVPSAVDAASSGTRVWPFGRVLRFVSMGHKERDLVSYYLELHTRAMRP